MQFSVFWPLIPRFQQAMTMLVTAATDIHWYTMGGTAGPGPLTTENHIGPVRGVGINKFHQVRVEVVDEAAAR